MKRKCFSWVLPICFLATIISLASVKAASAHHGGVSAAFGPGAPVETSSPQTLREGQFLLYERIELAPYKKYDWAKVENGGEGNTEQFSFYNTMLGYGVSDALSTYLILPYAVKEKDNVGTSEGFGDLELFLQYGFKYGERDGIMGWYKNGPDETAGKDYTIDDWKFALMGSMSFPSGNTNNNDANGSRFDLGMQPGFGVVTYQVGAATSKMVVPHVTLTMDTQYRVFAYSNRGTPGREWRVNAAAGYEVYESPGNWLSRIDLIGEANFLHLTEDLDGVREKERATGGKILYLSPALRFTFADRLSIGMMVKIPTWTDLNNKAEQQGAEGLEEYRAVCTVSYSF